MSRFRSQKHSPEQSRRDERANSGAKSPAGRWFAKSIRKPGSAICRGSTGSQRRCTSGKLAKPRKETSDVPATKGFFTDTTLCIGCKACEVACKQWNQLPDDGFLFTAMSYDNTVQLGASTWRHVAFIERQQPLPGLGSPRDGAQLDGGAFSWLMMSDVCKHCERAGCLEACPTGSILRTEFGSVYVQPDVCNGCGYCVSACPFGVIDRRDDDGRA